MLPFAAFDEAKAKVLEFIRKPSVLVYGNIIKQAPSSK